MRYIQIGSWPLISLFLFIVCACTGPKKVNKPFFEQTSVVFEPDGLYTSMRIPALVYTKKESLLAFCEGRIGSSSDWADMNLIMRRSQDEGKTWSEISVLDSMKGAPVGNPVPIIDSEGTIHLLYQKDYKYAYYIKSETDGIRWTKPQNITSSFDKFKPEYYWKVLAPGPDMGFSLQTAGFWQQYGLPIHHLFPPIEDMRPLAWQQFIAMILAKRGTEEKLFQIVQLK